MDQLSKIAEYANPDVLVTTEWLKNNLDNVIVVESDEDILLYETGHIPGAVKTRLAHRTKPPASTRLPRERRIFSPYEH